MRWTPHDLRRTVATHIAEGLGTGGEQLIWKILGHSDGSVTAIYYRYDYAHRDASRLRAVVTKAVGLTERRGHSNRE